MEPSCRLKTCKLQAYNTGLNTAALQLHKLMHEKNLEWEIKNVQLINQDEIFISICGKQYILV